MSRYTWIWTLYLLVVEAVVLFRVIYQSVEEQLSQKGVFLGCPLATLEDDQFKKELQLHGIQDGQLLALDHSVWR